MSLSLHVTSGLTAEQEKAVAIFNWVRDNIEYRVGLWQRRASQTIQEKKGTCTNKANLVVALLRLNNIPAGYGVLRTKGQDYIGPVVIPVLRRRIGDVSTHVYAFAYLDRRWIKCDPSADYKLSINTSNLNPQSRLVEWDGRNDAVENLDPSHILSEKGPIANIDHMMRKKAKNGRGIVIRIANLYIEFLRDKAASAKNVDELETLFYDWLIKEKCRYFLVMYFKLVTKRKDKAINFRDRFWAKYMKVYDVMNKAVPYKEMVEQVMQAGRFERGQLVLDAGSGTGIISIAIKNSEAQVISVDNSKTAMTIHKSKDCEAEQIIADLRQRLPFPNDHFDRVVCVLTLHVLSPYDRETIVGEFHRVLKPDGRIVLANPSVKFSSFRIFFKHVQDSIKLLGIGRSIYEIALFLVPITRMFYYNFILEFGRQSYKYLEFDEQKRYLETAGFSMISETKEIYAHSAILNWAIK
jgi:ubiquinone/menaquinone biosynthesis C-methylase UbiE